MKQFLSQHRVAAFIVFSYGISWLCWLPILHKVNTQLFQSPLEVLILFLLGGYGPSLAAIGLTAIISGRCGVKLLLSRLLIGKVGFKWYLFAAVFGPAIYAAALLIFLGQGQNLGVFNFGLIPWIPIVVLACLPLGPLAEELGWRGFMQQELGDRFSFIKTSVLVGTVWTFWHAPLFWAATGTAVSGAPVTLASVALYWLAVTGSAFIFTFLFRHTRGSVLMAVLLHLSLNASGTVSAMMFPEVAAEQRQYIYFGYVAVLWSVVLLGAFMHFARMRRHEVGLPVLDKPILNG